MRGNPLTVAAGAPQRRSIPACAGEPRDAPATPSARKVYPRVCGGTGRTSTPSRTGLGLSPRVRGNPHRIDAAILLLEVYPRVCGGTRRASGRRWRGGGLSPRVRGNQTGDHHAATSFGSIPACAGEPVVRWRSIMWYPVYPRVCGGTASGWTIWRFCIGLSPRVRGNPGRIHTA